MIGYILICTSFLTVYPRGLIANGLVSISKRILVNQLCDIPFYIRFETSIVRNIYYKMYRTALYSLLDCW